MNDIKKILIFSNGEKIGDGIIKLPLLHEIKNRLPNYKTVWMTNKGTTVYNSQLKNIASNYIDEIIEKAELNPFFWQKISNNYDLEKLNFDIILDTQRTLLRTISLKRISSNLFISGSGNGFFSNKKIKKKSNDEIRSYYLDDLFDLLNLIKFDSIDKNFKIPIPRELENILMNLYDKNESYIGIAPGAGEKNKIWPLDNFIKVAKYYENKSYKLVFFLGPQELSIKTKLIKLFPDAIIPEEKIINFSGPEVVIASTKFLSCALSNDSGVSHMLSTNLCPLVKLFGPKNPYKFTPKNYNIHTISSQSFGNDNINLIKSELVIKKINEILSHA
tara:strand:+ start:711 stop:1706 length:996 start_codon:yes stop_codon:yes gene_type:complete